MAFKAGLRPWSLVFRGTPSKDLMELESHYFGGKIESIRIVQDNNEEMDDDRVSLQHLLLAKAAAKVEEYDTDDNRFRKLTSSRIKPHPSRSSSSASFKLKYHMRAGGSWTFDHRQMGQQLYILEAETIQGPHLKWKIWRREHGETRRTIRHLIYECHCFMVSRAIALE